MSFVSTSNAAAQTIVISLGDNEFSNSFYMEVNENGVECGGYDTQRLPEMGVNGEAYHILSDLIEVCIEEVASLLPSAQQYVPAVRYGDIAQPEQKVWNYSKDVLSLAHSHKREEVINSKELLYGVELEFNHSNYSLQDLYPLLGMGIFKADSSVDGEYVTLPYTYDDMVRRITEVASSFDKLLSANTTLDAHSGVGMHVHLSRKGLTQEQLEFLRGLFDGSVTPYISLLCGRYPNKWCEYRQYSESRYVALNEGNKNTVEIRAFLSPSSAQGVLDNLKLIKTWVDHMDEWLKVCPEYTPDMGRLEEWKEGWQTPPVTTANSLAHRGWEVFDEEAYEAPLGGFESRAPQEIVQALTVEEMFRLEVEEQYATLDDRALINRLVYFQRFCDSYSWQRQIRHEVVLAEMSRRAGPPPMVELNRI